MILDSPFATPLRNRLRGRLRTRGRGQPASEPENPILALGPYTWYDAHLDYAAGAYGDLSGNGRADATHGPTTQAPLHLPYTDTAYLHLEAASAGTNSLSCTAPANTASYSAEPLDGGAATTDTAAAGAFTFTTAGDWKSVALLDASQVELAKYDATLSTKTGMTDSHSVAWTVNYGTAGGRSVVVGPLAVARSRTLLRTDDYIAVPSTVIPPMTVAAPWSFVIVVRQWATALSSGRWFDTRVSAGGTPAGIAMRQNGTTLAIGTVVGDGTANNTPTNTAAFTSGDLVVAAAVCDGSAVLTYVNDVVSASSSISALGNRTGGNGSIGKVGSSVNNPAEFSWFAWIAFDRAITTDDLDVIQTYYEVGS